MPSLLTSTQEALGGPTLPNCESRSLRLTRYARPELNDKSTPTRKAYLEALTKGSPDKEAAAAALAWQRTLPGAVQFHAKLEARLILNMAGSVLENAGLGLDRYGTVTIPGSAVKACARRAALATLRQWCETNEKPTGDDLLAPAADPFAEPTDLLLAILRVFGCTDLEWKDFDNQRNDGNDLAWACGNHWQNLSVTVRALLPTDTLRGSIAFLPAYPARLPKSDLELDVLTPHHKKYYEGNAEYPVALDNEPPVPVFFPAVAAEAEYTFTLLPLDQPTANSTPLIQAGKWLATGLTVFGLGAKTAAGFGWFKDIATEITAREAKLAEEKRAEAEKAAEEKRRADELANRKALEAKLASMTPDQRADFELAARAEDWGWMKPHLTKFDKHPPAAQAALLRWFCGAGRDRWLNEIKPEAAKGKKPWSQVIGAIHAAKKTHKITLP